MLWQLLLYELKRLISATHIASKMERCSATFILSSTARNEIEISVTKGAYAHSANFIMSATNVEILAIAAAAICKSKHRTNLLIANTI